MSAVLIDTKSFTGSDYISPATDDDNDTPRTKQLKDLRQKRLNYFNSISCVFYIYILISPSTGSSKKERQKKVL